VASENGEEEVAHYAFDFREREREIYSFVERVVCLNSIVTHASAEGKNGARLRTVAQRPPDTIPNFTPCLRCK